MKPTWNPHGTHMEPTWNTHGTHMELTWNPHGTHMEPRWKSHGNHKGIHKEHPYGTPKEIKMEFTQYYLNDAF